MSADRLQRANARASSAKQAIADDQALVDGQVELPKRCKMLAGQIVEFNGQKITVKA